MINWIDKGDIFKLNEVYNYAHGCNCAGAMGKGIALQFKKKFPKMFLEYKTLCKQGDFDLGDVFKYSYSQGVVYNLGTQKTWRTKATLEAVEESLTKMLKLAREEDIKKIALPRIGAGLGGLNWVDVKGVIIKVAKKYNTTLFIVENYG